MTDLSSYLGSIIGSQVTLNHDRDTVLLSGVKDDYITVYTSQDTVLHYYLHNLTCLSESPVLTENHFSGDIRPTAIRQAEELPNTFSELMESFRGRKIVVHGLNSRTISGFLFECSNDFIKIVTSPDDLVHYPIHQILSVSLNSRSRTDEACA